MKLTFEKSIALKQVENHKSLKNIQRKLKISYPTLKSKLLNNTFTLNEVKVLKEYLNISNSELVGVF